jgi:hypothetical protein
VSPGRGGREHPEPEDEEQRRGGERLIDEMAMRPVRLAVAAVAVLAALAAGLGAGAGPARADGDPASDVLVAAPPLFLGGSGGATYADARALTAQLRRARAAGHPLRVAVIATRSDLGSVTALWNRPQAYADFLGRELSLAYRGELLVVMPGGFGVAQRGAPVATALTGLRPRDGRVVPATEQAIFRLTGVAPARMAAPATRAAPSRIGTSGWWLASGVALLVLALAWGLSLRRRPPRRFSGAAGEH